MPRRQARSTVQRRALPIRIAAVAIAISTAAATLVVTVGAGTIGGLIAAPAAAAPAATATTPIQPLNEPTPIPGATNGELPQSDLINVAPGCEAARAAGPSLSRLLATAREEDVLLGTEQCYRSLADQEQEVQDWTAAGNSACAAPVNPTPGGVTDTSMHGWGKAADFDDADGTVAFGSPGYEFLQANAGRFGWNHPAWAQPGGSVCPEAWHWEWVGDGGVQGDTPIRADVVAVLPTADSAGYSTVTGLGAMTNLGDAVDSGSTAGQATSWVITAAARTPDGRGYWLVEADGQVHAYGDAQELGSTSGTALNSEVVGMAATPDGDGYWLLGADGGVFSFGDAHYWGSTGAMQPQLAHRRHVRHARWGRLLAGRRRRRDLQLRRRPLLGIDRRHAAQLAHRRHVRHARWGRLLAGRRRRRDLHVRRRRLPRLGRGRTARRSGRRDGPHRRRAGVLDRRRRRHDDGVRRRAVPGERLSGQAPSLGNG